MKIDKKMVELAKIIEGKHKPVEWADDFLTVEEMLKVGISWKTIQHLLNKKYKKIFTINGLVRDFRIYHTDVVETKQAINVKSPSVEAPDQTISSSSDPV